MSDSQTSLFGEDPPPSRSRGRSRAPDQLTPHQTKALHAWAEKTVPWVTRGAFESYTTLDDYVDEILEWWQADGGLKLDWLKTIQNRIRKLERGRVERLARSGSESAKLALRRPEVWAREHDRRARSASHVGMASDPGLIRPSGGQVLSINRRQAR